MMMKSFFLFILVINAIHADPTPIVLWHGMGDTCCWSFSLGGFKQFLEDEIPGVYVLSLEIGNNTIEDMENGYFMNPNKQVELACDIIANDSKLQGGFNAIGFSQGCQFLRALVQRCGHMLPRVKNLISLGGQHQGVYGLPNCAAVQHLTCDYVRKLLNYAAYNSIVQHGLVQATYWHDPLDEALYRKKSDFLAEINNERAINKTYIENLNKLEHFVMVKFEDDSVVQPRDTEWFAFYEPGQAKKILDLRDSPIYTKDRLGLKRMDKAGKLVFLSSPGNHLQFTDDWFRDHIIKPYLL
ncbi:hypothetical protein JYU34_021031 [Plutella xylostella]|uniref:Palmitoyl-protein thioesterase 1 n=1 Tax=Plutella xylostella TaxID=51655 RepID=A0ABQ7PSI4_PLUXY|nr:hypothetical protein JYU34_021031 [Plutella xylostella]